ncbi:MAG: DUF1573 domain-containing protein, partial [Acidobacteria bacterium]
MPGFFSSAALVAALALGGAAATSAPVAPPKAPEAVPKAAIHPAPFRFGKALRGTVVEHEYVLRNQGSAPLHLRRARMTPPLAVTRMPASVPPGGEARLRFRLDTAALDGPFDGLVLLEVDDPSQPELRLAFEGSVVPTVEVSPAPAVFLATVRGSAKEASVEIVNHEKAPLRLAPLERASTDRYAARIETIEKDKRYRLVVTIRPDGPRGKHSELLEVKTSSPRVPALSISINTYLRERVYTFPEDVDMGAVRLADLRDPGFADRLAQTLMVYQVGGEHFEAKLRTDLPFLKLE